MNIWEQILKKMADDPEISEIEANGHDSIYIKRGSKRMKVSYSFASNEEYKKSIENELMHYLIDGVEDYKEAKYLFESPLETKVINSKGEEVFIKARTHIVLPPVSVTPQITVARRAFSLNTLESLAERGSMSAEMLSFLKDAVKVNSNIVFSGRSGSGKALTHDTLIPTPNGFITMGEIKPGDTIFDHNGFVGLVENKFLQKPREVYEVLLSNGEKIYADLEHNWLVKELHQDEYYVLTTKELLETISEKEYEIPVLSNPIRYRKKPKENIGLSVNELPLHPYTFGYELGATGEVNSGVTAQLNSVKIDEKQETKIPRAYVKASLKARFLFLTGLIEGSTDKELIENGLSNWEFSTKSLTIAKSIFTLVSSLGFYSEYKELNNEYIIKVYINSYENLKFKFIASENVKEFKKQKNSKKIISIISTGRLEEMSCITVNTADSTYLVGRGFNTTHNTTMLEAATKLIPEHFRIGVAEDTPELILEQGNVTYLKSYPFLPGRDPRNEATLSWVTSQFQRNRVDKLIVGETRGKEFFDFLTLANSGMEGVLTTIHANDPKECLIKMNMFATAGMPELGSAVINQTIATAVDLIVQLKEFTYQGNRYRKIASIEEISRTINEKGNIATATLYSWDNERGVFIKNNQMQSMRKRFEEANIDPSKYFSTPVNTAMSGYSGASVGTTSLTNNSGRTL